MKLSISIIDPNHQDTAIPTTMINGYDDSSYGLGTDTASQARELKRQRIDSPGDDLKAQPGRCCFVTVGATAGFRSLLDEVSTAGFFDCLAKHGYTSLHIQCGPDLAAVEGRIASLSDEEKRGISVRCFHYTDEMTAHIVNCRGQANVRLAGCVISHGGKFSSHLGPARVYSVFILHHN
jgi:beta-1,4-N-acetylglucosaminyltransferase